MTPIQSTRILRYLHTIAHAPLLELVVGALLVGLAASEFIRSISESDLSPGWHHGVGLTGLFLVARSLAMMLEGAEFIERSSTETRRFKVARLHRLVESPVTQCLLGLAIAVSGIGELWESFSREEGARVWHAAFIFVGLTVVASSLVTLAEASHHLVHASRHASLHLPRIESILAILEARIACPIVRVIAGSVLIAAGLFEEVTGGMDKGVPGSGHESLALMGGMHFVKSLPHAVQKLDFVEEAVIQMSQHTSAKR